LASGGGFVIRKSHHMGRGSVLWDGGDGIAAFTPQGTMIGARLNLTLGRLTRGTDTDTLRAIEVISLAAGHDLVSGTQDGVWPYLEGGHDSVIGLSSDATLDGGDSRNLPYLSGGVATLTIDLKSGTASMGSQVTGWEFSSGRGALRTPDRQHCGGRVCRRGSGGQPVWQFDE
jgi:hypothetical protein